MTTHNPQRCAEFVVTLRKDEALLKQLCPEVKSDLAELADQLEAATAEVERLERSNLFRRSCEWHVATHPEPWTQFQPDFPKCDGRANCVGETPGRRSQYVLCREHAEQWDGDLVQMSGEAVAVPRGVTAERDALRAQLDLARRITPFSPEPCPLCEPVKSCSMHARIDEQSATIEQQRARFADLEAALLESVAEAQRASAIVDAATALCAALDRLRCANTQADRERMGLERLYAMRDLERAVARSQPKPVENSTPTSKGPI